MPTRNRECSRYYSRKQEEAVAKLLDAKLVPNSGACKFAVADVIADDWIFECKTCISPKQSFSLKREWFEKNERERMDAQKPYSALVFSFGEDETNYFVIPEKTFKIMYEVFQNENNN